MFHVKQGAEDFRVARNGAHPERARSTTNASPMSSIASTRSTSIGGGEHDCAVSELFPFRGKWHDFFEATFVAKQGVPSDQASALDFARYVWEGDDLAGAGRLRRPDRASRARASRSSWKRRRRASPGAARTASRSRRRAARSKRAPRSSRCRPACWRARSIRFAPSLPDWKLQAIDDLPLGSCNKVALGFTRNPFGDLDTVMLMPDLGPGQSVEFVVREGGRDIVTTMLNGPHAKALAARGRARHGGLRTDAACGNLRQRRARRA